MQLPPWAQVLVFVHWPFFNLNSIFLGNLRLAVQLPEGEDVDEWIAVNTVDFFNQINMLYGTITEFCTNDLCPIMSAGPKVR